MSEKQSDQVKDQIIAFGSLLEKWNASIALTSRKKKDFLAFHQEQVQEAFHLAALLNPSLPVVDLGSGNGYPSVVLSILGLSVKMIEISKKKSCFLAHTVSTLGLKAAVITQDIRSINETFHQITSKGFASILDTLLLNSRIWNSSTHFFLVKGKQFMEEIKSAEEYFTFSIEIHPIRGKNQKMILEIWNIKNAQ